VAAAAAVAGDFDASGAANAADYDVWKATFGSTSDLRADGNRNGQVDLADYAVWRNAVNAIVATSSSRTNEHVADEAVMEVVRESLSHNNDLLLAVRALAADDREEAVGSDSSGKRGDSATADPLGALDDAFGALV
jgi:hypothetical protein